MCGRFYFQFKQDSVSLYLQDLVQKNHLVEFASDEIFPSQEVLVLLQNKDSYDIDVMNGDLMVIRDPLLMQEVKLCI